MDEKERKEWEDRCTREDPPQCVAACPIHVDARKFLGFIAQRRFDDAWGVLHGTMPFPGILGRICDAPCQLHCPRQKAGGDIRIADIEKACVQISGSPLKIYPPLSKNRRIAVLGSGLSSLTAAWDLAKKGYLVTLFEESHALGRHLTNHDLSPETIDRELAVLAKLNIKIAFETKRFLSGITDNILSSFDALYLGFDALSYRDWGLDMDEAGAVRVTPMVQTTSCNKIFGGGLSASPVWQTASGRWAATSMDRFLQGISLTAGRDNEGPRPTRLFVSLKDIAFEPPVPVSDDARGYTEREAVQEARRCLQCQCLECVNVCRYLESFGAYPKRYVRDIVANEIMVKGNHKANKLINSCSLCGLCEAVCPEHMPMQDLCLQARQSMVRRDKMPPSAHEFAIRDMLFANGEEASFYGHEPGTRESAFLFFPGCQLGAIYPDHVVCIHGFLRDHLQGGVGILSHCCAVPARWAGREDLFDETCKELVDNWLALGSPAIIAACPTCYRTIKEILPDAKCIMLSEVFFEYGIPIPARKEAPGRRLAIHDPCSTRYEPSVQESVRRLLASLGCRIEELGLSREKTECCGFGGLMSNANPSLAKVVATTRSLRKESDYVTYCAMCRNVLASSGKRVIYLYDLLFGKTGEDYGARKPVDFSTRRENRRWLKNKLMHDLWGTEKAERAGHERIVLDLTHAANECMQERRILKEDIQRTIEHGETTGEKFYSSETGRLLTSIRSGNVRFWVEYEIHGMQFKIFRLYSHRMEVVNRDSMRDTEKRSENQWNCAKCNVGLQLGKTNISYLGNTFTANFLSCPICNIVLVSEDMATGKMAEVEQVLEDK